MVDNIKHEIELYPIGNFKIILDHEVRKSRRYKYPVTLIHIAVQADPNTPEAQHGAEMIAINALDISLRDSDIPCRDEHEFLVLLPSTDEQGGQSASDRLEKLLNASHQIREDETPVHVSAFIGLASTSTDAMLSAEKLLEQACAAMNHARANRSQKAILFSEIK